MRSVLEAINFKKLIRAQAWPSGALRLPRIQAHRGYWLGGVQENTMEAFRAARANHALMFECDVRLSKDNVPVVFHDVDISRFGGKNIMVKDLTAKELKEIVNAPSLLEVLTAKDVPLLVNIELKSIVILDDALERKVSEVVKKTKAQGRILFSSFNPFSLWRISQYLPNVPRALLLMPEDHPDNNLVLKKMMLAPLLRLHAVHLEKSMATDTEMRFWKKKKMPVAVWTVNDKPEIERHLKAGAISVITDNL